MDEGLGEANETHDMRLEWTMFGERLRVGLEWGWDGMSALNVPGMDEDIKRIECALNGRRY